LGVVLIAEPMEGSMELPVNRRTFLGGLTTVLTSGAILARTGALRGDGLAVFAEAGGTMRAIRLTTAGSDRATAYGMSSKCVLLDGQHLLCSWLDVARQNQWALVDLHGGAIVRRGTVGPPRSDNHCGVALCGSTDGAADCLVGAHHGSFMHYRMPAGLERSNWELIQNAVGEAATYPSLACDAEGTLHLTYRRNSPRPYHVMYSRRRPEDKVWSEPRPLVRAAVPVHTWTTHALDVGLDGRIHLVLNNTQTHPDGSWYYGASHLVSDDSGESWRQLGEDRPLPLPADAAALKRIEGDSFHADRTQSREEKQRLPATGPSQYYYCKIQLSNPVIDDAGRPWVVLHNLLRGRADLYHADGDAWIGKPLGETVRASFPGHQISHMGQLSRHLDGTIEVVLTIVRDDVECHRYGAKGTKLVRLLADAAGTPRSCGLVCEPDPAGIPDWQPNIQRPGRHAAISRPALLWTRGVNSHTLTETHTNVNEVTTEVWLQLPPSDNRQPRD
jgi:hypothetical protein